jgi:mono/diheme cytochrome c family protein
MKRNCCRARIFQTFAFWAFLLALICVLAVMPCAQAQSRKPAAAKGAPESGDVARGKYLVEGVAMCGECHTPRDGSGNLDRSRWLQGAPVLWAPANGVMSNWPLIAPRIGGNPPASDADMVKLLTTGVWTNGKELRFPMMPFRMSETDARAVVAYLKSVVPGK